MGKQPCDVCGEDRECFTYMDSNKKAHTVCSDECMDNGNGKGTDTSPVLGGGRMVLGKAFHTGWSVAKSPCAIEKGGKICPTCGLDDDTLSITGCPMKQGM